jgi:RNA polymerase sigma factor (sigma-70 family)
MIAFEQLYIEHSKLVYNLALQYVQNSLDTEDITQDVFIKIHHHLNTHNEAKASLKTWISQITINQCLDSSIGW